MNSEHESRKSLRVKKLAAYTSAASAGAFTMGQSSHGAIVYTDLTGSPITVIGGSTQSNVSPIDIDSDGMVDLSFFVYHYAATSADHIEAVQNSSLNVFTSVASYVGSAVYPIASFAYGATISGSSSVATNPQLRLTTDLPSAPEKTTFNDPGGAYLGLETSDGFNAWVHIETDISNSAQHTLTVYGYAYEDSGAAIVAGDIPAVPEPAETVVALGLLSAGVVGLSRWRRRKANQS